MSERICLALILLAALLIIWIWSLCMAIKQDILEVQRDRLDYNPGCDVFNLRGSGRDGRDDAR